MIPHQCRERELIRLPLLLLLPVMVVGAERELRRSQSSPLAQLHCERGSQLFTPSSSSFVPAYFVFIAIGRGQK